MHFYLIFCRKPNNTNNHESSPSGGEKLLRLLSVSEQRPDDENKENGGSVAAFFAQVSQASSTGVGPPPPPGLPAGARGMNPIQSLFTDPAVVSVEALENQPPPMPVAAKAASDLEHDMKPTKAKKAGHGKIFAKLFFLIVIHFIKYRIFIGF